MRRCLLVVGIAALAAACGDDPVAETSPTTPPPTGSAPTSDDSDVTDTAVPTTPDTSTTVALESTTTTESEPAATDIAAPDSTVAESTTTTSEPTVDTAPLDVAIVGIEADGDAVFVPAGGLEPQLLYDGVDTRDLPEPEEGPGPLVVDSVEINDDESVAFVGLCCEPIAGTVLRIDPANPQSIDDLVADRFGYAPAIDPRGEFVAVGVIQGSPASVADLATGTPLPAEIDEDFNFSPYDTMWIDDTRFVVLGVAETAGGTASVVFSASITDGTVRFGSPVEIAPLGDEVDARRFAGTQVSSVDGDTRIRAAVHLRGDSVIQLVDVGDGLEASLSATTLVTDEPLRSLWLRGDDDAIEVTADGVLRVGDTVYPGEYRWART